MRLIGLVLLSIVLLGSDGKPINQDYLAAAKYGYSAGDVYQLNRQKRREIKSDNYINDVAKALENDNIAAAQYADLALENLLSTAQGVLRANGHDRLADDIDLEFLMHYKNGFEHMALGIKEIGDYPPMSQWLTTVHDRIEDAIGNFLCEFFRFHDVFILNHGFPVILKPSKYSLKEYKDHFAGHPIWGWFWEHHGVAGVITYWVVQGVCSGMTSGLGLVTFACGPIASMAENFMDKRIAPPLAERIWKRNNKAL